MLRVVPQGPTPQTAGSGARSLPNPFALNHLPVSLRRRTVPKHYVVALEEPNIFSNFSPPH